jgi:two-component system response regulator AtoC
LTENTIESVRLLVVSREPSVLRVLGSQEGAKGWQMETASNSWEAMERMQSGAASHVLVLDIPLNDGDTLHFLKWLSRFRPDLPVVPLCCPEDASRVREATGLGGEDVVCKPFDAEQLESVIQRHLDPAGNGDADMASRYIEQLSPDTFFVSASLIMQKLRAQAALLAKTDLPVLIVGEAGSGKFTVAHLIHKLSVRSGFKLLRVNCAAMPEAMLEAELFGDDRSGSSRQSSLGKFAAGEKGTILLDEITAMPAGVQSRLLQVLQSNELRTPAGAEATAASVRILAASSANLDRVLAEKQLREDLYYRLSAFTLQVPSLRQRKDEIAILLRYFMHNLARHYTLPARAFSSSMLAACHHYSWPGNLRELEAFAKRYLVAGDEELMLQEIGAQPFAGPGHSPISRPSKTGAAAPDESRAEEAKAKPDSLKSLIQGVKREAERNAIGAALLRTGWNRKAAARLLKVSYRTLLYKIEQYQMRAPQPYFSPLPAGEFPVYQKVKNNGDAS